MVRQVVPRADRQLTAFDEAHAEIYRAHSLQERRDLVPQLRAMLQRSEFKTAVDFA